MHKYTNGKVLLVPASVVKLIQRKRADTNWKQTKSLVWPSFLLLSSVRWLCLLPPSFSLLYPQTPSSVFSLHRWVIPHLNNGLLCFIEPPMSLSHFLYSFPSSVWRGILFLFCSLFSFSLSSHSWEDWWLKWKKWRKEAANKEDEWRVFYKAVKERKRKEIDKFAKVGRRWRETWNNGKWRTARWLLENGGLDRE